MQVDLAEDQQKAFRAVESSDGPWFISGPAGTGKSKLLEYLRDNGKDSAATAVLAFTGAAAVNVDGVTIHSFALNSKSFNNQINVFVPLPGARELRKKNFEVMAAVRLLIIDEVSMARADMIDALDRAMRMAKNKQIPFGGARVVMFGDLYQLPPVLVSHELLRRERKFLKGYEDPEQPYFFQAHVFANLEIQTFDLYIPKRQDEKSFIDPLNDLRSGTPTKDSINFFNNVAQRENLETAVHLFAKRKPAREFNETKLKALEGVKVTYEAQTLNLKGEDLEPYLGHDDSQPAPAKLDLKPGSLVMILKNLDFEKKLVNGAVGTVTELRELSVLVRMVNTDRIEEIAPADFDLKGYVLDSVDDNQPELGDLDISTKKVKSSIIGVYRQLPLQLCWGMTIHKAQGQTLDRAVIDFRENYIAAGQAYVALSRIRSQAGLGMMGYLGYRHLAPYSPELRKFLDRKNATVEVHEKVLENNLARALNKVAASMPWRPKNWVFGVVDSYLEGIPQLRDGQNFDHKRRALYLKHELNISPSEYLRNLMRKNPDLAVTLCRNIDRSVRNKPIIYDEGYLGDEFEILLRNEFELTGSQAIKRQINEGDSWAENALSRVGSGEDLEIEVLGMPSPKVLTWLSPSGKKRFVVQKEGFFYSVFAFPGSHLTYAQPDENFRVGKREDTMIHAISKNVHLWAAEAPDEITVVSEFFEDSVFRSWLRYVFIDPSQVQVNRVLG